MNWTTATQKTLDIATLNHPKIVQEQIYSCITKAAKTAVIEQIDSHPPHKKGHPPHAKLCKRRNSSKKKKSQSKERVEV